MRELKCIEEAALYLEERSGFAPEVALVLGSGLGALAEEITGDSYAYEDIPHFPEATVPGHAGTLIFGRLSGRRVCAMQGRFHSYEGYSMQEIVRPVRVINRLGAKILVITNAAGGINPDFNRGDLMLITDHINLLGDNPLIGPNLDEYGPRFPDMTEPYSLHLLETAEAAGREVGLNLRRGIYVATRGPSYETKAEIVFMSRIGADAVGMSTVPGVIAANHMGMEVLGISCITNMAAGVLPQKLDHREVLETTEQVKEDFCRLIKTTLRRLA